jgi:hypothetical protein
MESEVLRQLAAAFLPRVEVKRMETVTERGSPDPEDVSSP